MSNEKPPLVVFVHAYYPDVWKQIAARLAFSIDVPFRVFATTPDPNVNLVRPQTTFLRGMDVVITENRGRDVRPFLEALRQCGDFEVGLKLHTKRSFHRLEGAEWSEAILASLLPDPAMTQRVIRQLAHDQRVGIVGPDGCLLSLKAWAGRNRYNMTRFASQLGFESPALLEDCPYFVAGSMFWFSRRSLLPLTAAHIGDIFEPESGQTDGTAAHAMERLFTPLAAQSGLLTTTMSLYENVTPETPYGTIRSLSLIEAEKDQVFFPRHYPAIASVAGRIPFLISIYRKMPTPLRWAIRAVISRLS
jgi:lipopolysaccharide biosynthesis protein